MKNPSDIKQEANPILQVFNLFMFKASAKELIRQEEEFITISKSFMLDIYSFIVFREKIILFKKNTSDTSVFDLQCI